MWQRRKAIQQCVIEDAMTPEDILNKFAYAGKWSCFLDDEEMKKFIQGFAYKPPKKERGLMIRDYCEWRQKQEPFVDDKEFFIQNYKVNPDQLLMDLFKEIYLLRKELDEQCDDE